MSADPKESPGAEPTSGQGASYVSQLGVYWPRATWDLARSAYVADLDSDPDSPVVFTAWLARAIEQHAVRTSSARAKVASRMPQAKQGRGVSKGHRVGQATIEALEDAIVADRQHGRLVSRSAFVLEAVHAAADAARARLARPLPPPPAKLSNRPPRRRTNG